MAEERRGLPHKLTLNERKTLTMNGVTEVVSFDEDAVVLKTDIGTLVIQGHGLQLKTLSPEGGLVEVNGNVCALIYEAPKRGGILRRLFG